MKNTKVIFILLLIVSIVYSCKKRLDSITIPPSPVPTTKQSGVLIIENGAGRFEPGFHDDYVAYVVDQDGNRVDVNGVTWSSSNQAAVTISGNTLSAVGVGNSTIKATVTYNGETLTASVPVAISTPSIFTVLPGVVMWFPDADPIYLEPIYVGSGSPGTYTYSSSDPSVASVSSTGILTLHKTGECVITVTAPGLDGQPTVEVPVLSIGEPTVSLPVSRIVITPSNPSLFIGEQLAFSAKAYNLNNEEVSASLTWSLTNDTIASIDANGNFSALHSGVTKVQVMAYGIMSEVEVYIYPHKVIEVSPFIASIAPSKSKQFVAQTYLVSKSGNSYNLTPTSNPVDLTWEIPTFGIPDFDIATVNSTGLVTMKSNASVGMFAILGAYSPADLDIEPGVVIIDVSNCDCGIGTGVTMIVPVPSSYTLSLLNSPMGQITTTTFPVGSTLHYCSQDPSIVSVDQFGNIMGVSPGVGSITVCDGNIEANVTVTVTF